MSYEPRATSYEQRATSSEQFVVALDPALEKSLRRGSETNVFEARS